MKKIMTILLVLITIFIASINNQENTQIVIPKESIRFRVIASSNSSKDQAEKEIVADNLKVDVMKLLKDANSLEDARKTLSSNINEFKTNIDKTLLDNKINSSYSIDYGSHYFPEKEYRGVHYKAGQYESLVVTLGDGAGKNFWCVLFPPLCLLEAEEIDEDEIKYTSFVKEIIDKYFS